MAKYVINPVHMQPNYAAMRGPTQICFEKVQISQGLKAGQRFRFEVSEI